MRRLVLSLILCVSVGCSGQVSVTPTAAPVDVKGTVSLAGSPVSGVVLNLQPTGAGLPAEIDISGGEFSAQIVPGTYTWYISEGKDKATFKKVPEKYQTGALDRQEGIQSGTSLALTLD